MKAIFLNNGTIADIQINEACSSGCGSFIETLARSLGYDVETFASLACGEHVPFDLGTRCTVFMNSRIKEAQRQGASVEDISAGLAYAVVKNSLYKVLKLHNVKKLWVTGWWFTAAPSEPRGVKGARFLTGKEVVRPDAAELMGAYGAAIVACENHRVRNGGKSAFVGFRPGKRSDISNREAVNCRGCENTCRVTGLTFTNGRRYFTGNRCERIFNNGGDGRPGGVNMVAEKARMLFDRPCDPEGVPVLSFRKLPGPQHVRELPLLGSLPYRMRFPGGSLVSVERTSLREGRPHGHVGQYLFSGEARPRPHLRSYRKEGRQILLPQRRIRGEELPVFLEQLQLPGGYGVSGHHQKRR